MNKRILLLAATASIMYLTAAPTYAGEWKADTRGWWWQNDDGSYPSDCWKWLDGNMDGVYEHYYFDRDGYLVSDMNLSDGSRIDENGALIMNGMVQTVRTEVQGSDDCGSCDGLDKEVLKRRIEELINQERVRNGQSGLERNTTLQENAELRAQEIMKNPGHIRLDGSKFSSAITVDYKMAGENIVYIDISDSLTEDELSRMFVNSWIESESHKKNIVRSSWKETGVGISIQGNSIYVVQLFVY